MTLVSAHGNDSSIRHARWLTIPILQLHFAHQRAHRLLKRQVVQLARAPAAQQAAHGIVDAERKLLNQLAALPDAVHIRRQPLDDPTGLRIAIMVTSNVIVRLANAAAALLSVSSRRSASHFGYAHQLLQRLIQLAQP